MKSFLVLIDPSLVLDSNVVVSVDCVLSSLVFGDPSLVSVSHIVNSVDGVLSSLILVNPFSMALNNVVVPPLSFKTLLILGDPLGVVPLDGVLSHHVLRSVFSGPVGLSVDSCDSSSATSDDSVLSSPLVGSIRHPFSHVGPVGFVSVVWLVHPVVVSRAPSSVGPGQVWKSHVVSVAFPLESSASPNESVKSSAMSSVFPD